MSQALRDLPDPTQPAPVLPTTNADDLLAKMADEAIDKLLAEADKGPSQPAIKLRQPTEPSPIVDEPLVAEAAVNDMLTSTAPPAITADVGEPSAASPAVVPPAAEPLAAPVSPAQAEADIAAPAGSPVDAVNVASDTAVPPPKDDVKVLLTEEVQSRPSPLLWPLWLLNAPFAWMSDRARQALGLIGIVTLVPAVCAIVYVLYMKKH